MKKRNPMAYKPIFPLLMSMAFPPMISMLIQSLYNIVDSIFVAQLGEEALTAVSLIYPLQNLSLAFSCGVGIALNAIIARHLGAHNDKEASFVATQGIVMTLLPVSYTHLDVYKRQGRYLEGFKKSKADVHIDKAQQILITQNKKYLRTETSPNCKVIYVPGKFDSINFNYQIMTICDLIRLHYFQQYYL